MLHAERCLNRPVWGISLLKVAEKSDFTASADMSVTHHKKCFLEINLFF